MIKALRQEEKALPDRVFGVIYDVLNQGKRSALRSLASSSHVVRDAVNSVWHQFLAQKRYESDEPDSLNISNQKSSASIPCPENKGQVYFLDLGGSSIDATRFVMTLLDLLRTVLPKRLEGSFLIPFYYISARHLKYC